jgi:type III secretory pathway component EscS
MFGYAKHVIHTTASLLLLIPIIAVGCVVVAPVVGVVFTVSLYRACTARNGDVLVASYGIRATVLSTLGIAVVEMPRHTSYAFFVVYNNAFQLIQNIGYSGDIFHMPTLVESPSLVDLVAHVESMPINLIVHGPSKSCNVDKADIEAMRAIMLWTLQRPVRLVQRTWRAHVRRRLRWAVGVVERGALTVIYRPGGVFYQDAVRRWAASTIVVDGERSSR